MPNHDQKEMLASNSGLKVNLNISDQNYSPDGHRSGSKLHLASQSTLKQFNPKNEATLGHAIITQRKGIHGS